MTTIHIPPSWRIPERSATPEGLWLDRRTVLRTLGLGTLALTLPRGFAAAEDAAAEAPGVAEMLRPALGKSYVERFPAKRNPAFGTSDDRAPTPEAVAGAYNNFYEFTVMKEKVWRLARGYEVEPWTVKVHGLVKKPMTLGLDDILKRFPLEERLYRFRCVERWAMQVPWTGFPLRALIDHLEPLGTARYVRFGTVHDKEGMPGVRNQRWYPWPYFEGLRLDEARHELAFVVVGSYGHALPMQHGAPWRLALPWKYGYKGPKSIVEIELTSTKPKTFWNEAQPSEYGFYSNVEPHKPHARWSQKWERDIGTGEMRDTLLYNGYAEEVAALYDGSEV
jgi:sulfoxide reductase catalytic subunit YedY